jgi:DNA-binding CsgD family transcriptional regulator
MYRFCEDLTSMSSAVQPCIVVMDGERRLLQASPGARRLLANCQSLRLVHDILCAETNAEGARLSTAFRAVIGGEDGERTVRLGHGSAQLDVTLALIEGTGGERQVIATVRIVAQHRTASLDEAAQRFGLTPAEARLLDILCTGVSVPQAAMRLGVARTTARTHLQRIFDKSGARRQSDLQRLVFAPALAA